MIEYFVNDSKTPKLIKLGWAKAGTFSESDAWLKQTASAMGLTGAQVGAIFSLAEMK